MKAFGKEGDLCVNLFMARDDDDDDMYRGNVLIRFYGPSTVKQDEEIEIKSKAPDFFFLAKLSTYIFSEILLICLCLQGKIKKKRKGKKNIRASNHSSAIRQAFFLYAVCCTKLFKKPSALCKEITFFVREEIKVWWGWGSRGVSSEWYSPVVLNPDL